MLICLVPCKMSFGDTLVNELTLTEIIIGLVIVFILTSVWQRTFDNFFYGTLGIDKTSSYETLVLAFAVTIFFIVLLRYVTTFAEGIILGVSAPNSRTAAHNFFGMTEETDVEEKQPCDSQTCCKEKKTRNGFVSRSR